MNVWKWKWLLLVALMAGLMVDTTSAQTIVRRPNDASGGSTATPRREEQPPVRSIPGTARPADEGRGEQAPHSVPGTSRPADEGRKELPGAPGIGEPADGRSSQPRSVPNFPGVTPAGPGTVIIPAPTPVVRWQLGINTYAAYLPVGSGGEVGMYIAAVGEESPAERMGVEQGDFIVQINGQSVQSLRDVRWALDRSRGYVRMLVLDHRTGEYMWHRGYLY